ncbi:MAG TPA: DNA mismatch repair protein MutS [bacterium]|nr:DNA mismatch repair protein MutS [bacterium]
MAKNQIKETPLMAQYQTVKAQVPDAVVFFRMGDFYEMFNEDAHIGARVLGITLTSRGHGKAGDVPLAGFPHHALDGYLAKMVKAGYRVAICEQVEDPRLAKGIVKRDIIQVVTPGTVTQENLLVNKRNNFLTVLVPDDETAGIAVADVSTGEFRVTEIPSTRVEEELQAIAPSEIVMSESHAARWKPILDKMGIQAVVTCREPWIFSRPYGMEVLTRHFGTASLKGFGCEDLDSGIAAAGAAVHYLKETQKSELTHIRRLIPYRSNEFMTLDRATRRNLELTDSIMDQGRQGTLISVLDRTVTAMGGRTLAAWLRQPLNRLRPIQERLNAVEALFSDKIMRRELTNAFKSMGDLERLGARVVTRRATPRDLKALGSTLAQIPLILSILSDSTGLLKVIQDNLSPCDETVRRINDALDEDPPQSFDGHVFRRGYHAQLDELRDLAFSGKDWIARLQKSERERTGIPSLKVGYNRVFGYYLEVTRPHLNKVPDDYHRKQTLVNAERFITPELKEMEEKILHAEEKMEVLERRLFEELRDFVGSRASEIQENGVRIGQLDALLALAAAAEASRYVKPSVHEGPELLVVQGRHPVVEKLLDPSEPFVPNDVRLDTHENQLIILTGPNMAGKSTYLRQVGLIVLMAQIGSFVPADEARIGIVDRIFTRVGARDNVAGGESTFLVEMNETANILNNATEKSLILLDEIGRGTSTFDGLSIAWAVAEYLHDEPGVRAKTIFATHYHELTELALICPRAKNFNVAVREWGDHIVFLRTIVPGACDHSYGIQVARLAGVPARIIERAREVLNNLESNELTPNAVPKLALGEHAPMKVAQPQLYLFAEQESKLRDILKKVDVNTMTPLEALQLLHDLTGLIDSE